MFRDEELDYDANGTRIFEPAQEEDCSLTVRTNAPSQGEAGEEEEARRNRKATTTRKRGEKDQTFLDIWFIYPIS